jgi:hypothetical protein
MARLLGALPDDEWVANKKLVRASVSLLGLEYSDLVWRMLKRVGLGILNKTQVITITGLIGKLQKDSEAKELTHDFAKTLKLPRGEAFSPKSLTLKLRKLERLDEFFQKLLPILLKQPELSLQTSNALARLYLRQTVDDSEEAS